MQTITSEIPRTEQAIFNLIRIVNELCALQLELSIQDMDQIEQELDSTLANYAAKAN